jgi:hypothetical protein
MFNELADWHGFPPPAHPLTKPTVAEIAILVKPLVILDNPAGGG